MMPPPGVPGDGPGGRLDTGGTVGVPTFPEIAVAWLWNDTIADLLETFDRVEPEALSVLRSGAAAYRVDDERSAVEVARAVFAELRTPPAATSRPPAPA